MEHSFEEKKYKTKSNNIKTIVIVFSFFLFFSDVIWRCVHSLQARKLSWMKGSIHRLSSLNRQLSTFHSCHMTINIANFFYALIAVHDRWLFISGICQMKSSPFERSFFEFISLRFTISWNVIWWRYVLCVCRKFVGGNETKVVDVSANSKHISWPFLCSWLWQS